MYKKLLKQEFAIGEDIFVNFESYVDERGATITIKKGDNVTYQGIHSWLRKQKKEKCEFCDKKELLHLALKKNKKHERKIENYLTLCVRCHRKYDAKPPGHRKRASAIDPIRCEACGTKFIPRRKTTRFCSNKCRIKARNKGYKPSTKFNNKPMNYATENGITEEILKKYEFLFRNASRKRMIAITRMRLYGSTLMEIAKHFKITKETVRQKEAKTVQLLKEYMPKSIEDLKENIETLGIPCLQLHCLMNSGIDTVSMLNKLGAQNLISIIGLGPKGANIVREYLTLNKDMST